MPDIKEVLDKLDEIAKQNTADHKEIASALGIQAVTLGKQEVMTNANIKSIGKLFNKIDKLTWGFILLLISIIGVTIKLVAGE